MDICPLDRCPMYRCPLTIGNPKRNKKHFAQTKFVHLPLLDLFLFHMRGRCPLPLPCNIVKRSWYYVIYEQHLRLFCPSRVEMTTMLLVNLAWRALWQIVIDLRQSCASFKFCKHREEILKPVSLSM